MATTVAVLGGGVGGLSAAHELAERGFAVTVYEKRARRRQGAHLPDAGRLPAEHGFRFFPAFYRHLPDTMARIPSGAGARATGWSAPSGSCSPGRRRERAHRAGARAGVARRPGVLARFVFDAATQLGVPAVDVAWLLERLFTLLASCDERRVEQWDRQSWWEYVQADQRSEAFRQLPRRRADAHARRRPRDAR